jgi:phosphatidylglycerol phospholipase C
MLQKVMVGPFGNAFLRDARKANRLMFFWTVNEEAWMKWSIRKEVDGVITDDPKKYLEVVEKYQGEKIHLPLRSWGPLIWKTMLAAVFSLVFRYRHGFKVDV